MRYVLVVLLIVGAAGGGYYVATRANPPAQSVPTVVVTRGPIDVTVSITGSASAKRSRGLAFGTPGTVAVVNFASGDAVKLSDVIAQLDTTVIDTQFTAAQSALTSAQSALKATRDARDAVPSRSPGSSAPPTLPGQPSTAQLDASVDAAQAAVDSAAAAISAAKLARTGAVIRAPYDGTLTQVLIHVGDYVAPGPVAGLGFPVEISDAAVLDIVAGASEDDVVQLAGGQAATVRFDALPNARLTGKVCEIPASPISVQGVPTFPVRICLDGSDPGLRLGLTATVEVVVAHRDSVVLVPNRTIRISGDDHLVNLVTAGTSVPTTVQVGETDGTSTEILSGLNEGDRIETTR